MYPTTQEQGIRWLTAISLEKDFIPSYGCCEVVSQSDGRILVRKPTLAGIRLGSPARYCFAGPNGIPPNKDPENDTDVKGVVTFDRPATAKIDRRSVASVEGSSQEFFRMEWATGDNINNADRTYAGPVADSYSLSFGINNWWEVLLAPLPEKKTDPDFGLVLPNGRSSVIPSPCYGFAGEVYTAAAGETFGIPLNDFASTEWWPSFGNSLLSVTRMVTPYWYGRWQIAISATLWSADAERGARLSISAATRQRGGDFNSSNVQAAREQDITISAYGDTERISKENVACQHNQFLKPFTEIDILNTSQVECSISDVTISLVAINTPVLETDLTDYDDYEETLSNLGL